MTSMLRFLKSRHAAWLTHISLLAMECGYFALLAFTPFWMAFAPSVLIAHRAGVLVHDYIHGIPFKRYRRNLAVVTLFDGLMLMFGTVEMFRGTHLAHHRWLNMEQDPASESAGFRKANTLMDALTAVELVQYLVYFRDVWLGRKPYVRRNRVLLGMLLSTTVLALCILAGRADAPAKMLAINIFTILVPVSLRGAIEHHSHRGDSRFANEYRVRIPLFNLNRHIHHHEDPSLPWYLLEFRSPQPLPSRHYFTHWYHVYIKRDFVLMRPMTKRASDRQKKLAI
jgi:fatty acid desaturase